MSVKPENQIRMFQVARWYKLSTQTKTKFKTAKYKTARQDDVVESGEVR